MITYKLLISSKFTRYYTLKSGIKENGIIEQKGQINAFSFGEEIQEVEEDHMIQELNVNRPLLNLEGESTANKMSWIDLYKQVFFLVIQ